MNNPSNPHDGGTGDGPNDASAQAQQTKVIVALCYANKTLGIACYDELKNCILCDGFSVSEEDVEKRVRNIKENLDVTLFVLHPNICSSQAFLEMVLADLEGAPNAYRFATVKSSCWNEAGALELVAKCLTVRRSSSMNNSNNMAADDAASRAPGWHCSTLELVAATIDLENAQLKRALGALLSFMQQKVFHMDDGRIIVSSVGQLPVADFMRLDAATLTALQIFAEEWHPNQLKGVGRAKEGFSLFGLFDRTHSLAGRAKLREWMHKPFCDAALIRDRQCGVELVARHLHSGFIKALVSPLRHVHDMSRLLLRIKKVEATPADWRKLFSSLLHAIRAMDEIRAFVLDNNGANSEEDCLYMRAQCGHVDVAFMRRLWSQMDACVDFEDGNTSTGGLGGRGSSGSGGGSSSDRHLYVRDGFDPQLDGLRATFACLEGHLVRAAHEVLEAAPLLQNVAVEYVPQIGYLVAVADAEVHLLQHTAPAVDSGGLDIDGQDCCDVDNSFAFVYSQDGMSYFKHAIVFSMDDSLGDIQSAMLDRQRQLLLQLEDVVLDGEPQLQHVALVLAQLDALISLGIIAVEQRLVRPEVSETENVVVVSQGRHLLQELAVDSGAFVANDTYISAEKNVALITGPNNSGKSVYLRQVGLLVYLTHIGSFVPAERAVIGLTDQIFTRIKSTESVSSAQSSFSIDLHQVSRMLAQHSNRSLCLVDEFGKGTAPTDGIALLAAVVRHFVQRGCKALFALHFTEIVHPRILGGSSGSGVSESSSGNSESKQQQQQQEGTTSRGDMDHISCFCMSMLKPPPSEDEEEEGADAELLRQNTPLYRLVRGVASSSEGIPCARLAGMPTNTLQRACAIRRCIQKGEALAPDPALLAALTGSGGTGTGGGADGGDGGSSRHGGGTEDGDEEEEGAGIGIGAKSRQLLQVFLETSDWRQQGQQGGPVGSSNGNSQHSSKLQELLRML